jgi:hypothetical protein
LEGRTFVLARSSDLLQRLRAIDVAERVGGSSARDWSVSGVRFACSTPAIEARYYDAVRELFACIAPAGTDAPILNEGGIYRGCWLESTGTISAELLCRFLPALAERTFRSFADHQRADGLFPYKLTEAGPAFSQIQLVTPLARSVWTHHSVNGMDRAELARLYAAMSRYDDWLATWRDTRGTGCVEAFCCYDTGHDLSPRFWHIPDSPAGNDPTACPDNPVLPFLAPDLTANVACQRHYLALIAEELGEDPDPWRQKAEASAAALMRHCLDAADGCFYDRDRENNFIHVQSDVLLRVLACEIGDDALFARSLTGYLLNTRKFFAKYPFTSIALDDPRYDPAFDYNSWAGPTNLLSLIRAPHAFEAHDRHVELTWAMQPAIAALVKTDHFPQTLHPFTGRAGFTEGYSPAILCLIDFIERLSGIMPRPDGTLWFTALTPHQIEHRDASHETAYARIVDGRRFELVNAGGSSTAYCDDDLLFECTPGVRIVTDRGGHVLRLIGMRARPVIGTLHVAGRGIDFTIAPNEQMDLTDTGLAATRRPGLTPPSWNGPDHGRATGTWEREPT